MQFESSMILIIYRRIIFFQSIVDDLNKYVFISNILFNVSCNEFSRWSTRNGTMEGLLSPKLQIPLRNPSILRQGLGKITLKRGQTSTNDARFHIFPLMPLLNTSGIFQTSQFVFYTIFRERKRERERIDADLLTPLRANICSREMKYFFFVKIL